MVPTISKFALEAVAAIAVLWAFGFLFLWALVYVGSRGDASVECEQGRHCDCWRLEGLDCCRCGRKSPFVESSET
jgi:hypothetical protein